MFLCLLCEANQSKIIERREIQKKSEFEFDLSNKTNVTKTGFKKDKRFEQIKTRAYLHALKFYNSSDKNSDQSKFEPAIDESLNLKDGKQNSKNDTNKKSEVLIDDKSLKDAIQKAKTPSDIENAFKHNQKQKEQFLKIKENAYKANTLSSFVNLSLQHLDGMISKNVSSQYKNIVSMFGDDIFSSEKEFEEIRKKILKDQVPGKPFDPSKVSRESLLELTKLYKRMAKSKRIKFADNIQEIYGHSSNNPDECISLHTHFNKSNSECVCDKGYTSTDPKLLGCWKCNTTCHEDATCSSPGICTCNSGFFGDGIQQCNAKVFEISEIEPKECIVSEGCTINVFFKNDGLPFQKAYCKFDESIVAASTITQNSFICSVPPSFSKKLELRISLNKNDWSSIPFIVKVVPVSKKLFGTILYLVVLFITILTMFFFYRKNKITNEIKEPNLAAFNEEKKQVKYHFQLP